MVNILVVDDHPLMRRAVCEVVAKESDLLVVAEASNGDEAEMLATQTQPDVVVMDADMPDCSGFEATERILACSPHSRVIIFTAAHHDQQVVQAIQTGAMGYITKDVEPDALIHAIRCAARNELCIPGAFAIHMLAHLRSHWHTPSSHTGILARPIAYRTPRRTISNDLNPLTHSTSPRPLTDREVQILDLMRRGRKNREIASELCIAESTVHKHVQNIFEKLHARNRTEAIYLTSAEVAL
jgi:two-component system nitrate/nitrite response regulator NarL